MIKIKTESTEYTFVGWKKLSGTGQLENLGDLFGDGETGYFKITKDGSTDVFKIIAVFKPTEQSGEINLLWLWISLGALGLILIVVLIIVVVKKKKGNNSYKKYMY